MDAWPAEFVPGLLGALAAVDVLLIGLEDDIVLEGVVVEIVLFFTGLQVSADLVMRVDGLMMAVRDMLLLVVILLLGLLGIQGLGILKHALLLGLRLPPGLQVVVLLVSEVAAVLGD